MTAHHLTEDRLTDGIPVQRLLEGLARVYRWILVVDARRRVIWTSDALSELDGAEDLVVGEEAKSFLRKLPRPEQVFPLRTNLRERSHLRGAPIELRKRDGTIASAEVDVVRVDSSEGELLMAIACPVEREGQQRGPDTALIDAAPNSVLVIDAEGFVTHANPAAVRLLGGDRAALAGRPAALLFGESASEIEGIALSLARDGGAAECELMLPREDGSGRAMTATAVQIGGGVRALYLQDAAPTTEIEHQLRSANAELEHCVNALAHDLRSPLVALLGFSRLLRQDYAEAIDDTGQHFIDRIEQAARTMETLIHDLLELARIGQVGERPALVDPHAVLLQLKGELKPRLDEAGIDLALPDSPPPLVYCDRTRLYQVFSNLIGNAIEHMGAVDAPRIEVSVVETEESHVLRVRDNGRGIPEEHHGRIFEVFQSHGIRQDGRRGTGIGLAIVKKIAEMHGGRVWLDVDETAGACFHVSLPRH